MAGGLALAAGTFGVTASGNCSSRQVVGGFVAERRRSHEPDCSLLTVDIEKMEPLPVPVRRAADGALVADWGRIPARVYAAGLADDGRRTMTACLEAIASRLSGGRADIDSLPGRRRRPRPRSDAPSCGRPTTAARSSAGPRPATTAGALL